MDIALALELLVPAAKYRGSLTLDHITRNFNGNPHAAYRALVWEDTRSKPAWADIEGKVAEADAILEAVAKREKASEAILGKAQLWQQLNMSARVLELVNQKFDLVNDPSFTQEERDEMVEILTLWQEIKAIREESNQ